MSLQGGPVLFDNVKRICHYFGDKTEFSIGRSADSSLDIVSKFISRNQCLIKFTEEKEWAITDLSSFKSTRINSKPSKSEWQVLKNGDRITFSNHLDEELVFYKDSSGVPSSKKRKLIEPILICNDVDIENSSPPNPEIEGLKKKNILLLDEIAKLSEENKNANDKYQKLSLILEQTQKSLEDMEAEKSNIALKLIDEQTTKERVIIQMQNYIDSLKECEMELNLVAEERNTLKQELMEKEKATVGSNMSSQISEFNNMKEENEKIRKELLANEGRLNEVLAEKDILSSNVSDLLEQEFSCSVCSDIFYQATSLDCRHTFCAKCVATWKLNKKECPVCRAKIKVEVMPLVIDSFIDKLTELIGGEFKQRRDDIKVERASNRPPGSGVSPYRFPQIARRGGQRRQRGAARQSHRRHSNMMIRAGEYAILVSHLQGLAELAEPIDLTNSPPERSRR